MAPKPVKALQPLEELPKAKLRGRSSISEEQARKIAEEKRKARDERTAQELVRRRTAQIERISQEKRRARSPPVIVRTPTAERPDAVTVVEPRFEVLPGPKFGGVGTARQVRAFPGRFDEVLRERTGFDRPEEQARRVQAVRGAIEETTRPVAILGERIQKSSEVSFKAQETLITKQVEGSTLKYVKGAKETLIAPSFLLKEATTTTGKGIELAGKKPIETFTVVGGAYLGFKFLTVAPPAVRAGLDLFVVGKELPKAFDPERPKGQRVISGTFAGLGALGLYAELKPFIGFAKYKVQTIKVDGKEAKVLKLPDDKTVAIIPPGKVAGTKPTDPGFITGTQRGIPLSIQKKQFAGKLSEVATTQTGLIKSKGQVIEFERALFATPSDPSTGFLQIRESRLGLGQGFFSFNLQKAKDIQLVVVGGEKQAILIEKTRISSTVLPKDFPASKLKQLKDPLFLTPTRELETISARNLQVVEKLGKFRIRGQLVTLYQAKLVGSGTKSVASVSKEVGALSQYSESVSLPIPSVVSGVRAISVPSTSVPTRTQRSVSPSLSVSTKGPSTLSTLSGVTSIKQTPSTPQAPSTGRSGSVTAPSIVSPPVSRPPSRPPSIYTPSRPPREEVGPPRFPSPKRSEFKRPKGGTATVEVRRRGRFDIIGTGLSLREAISLGARQTGATLGATFRVKGAGREFTPRGFTAKGRGVFVEQPSLRLDTLTERAELKRARKRKR